MITLWMSPTEQEPITAHIVVRTMPSGKVTEVAYEDDNHVWVVKWERGVVTVFRRSRGATKGGNALVLGDPDTARQVLTGLLNALDAIMDKTSFGWHGGIEGDAL